MRYIVVGTGSVGILIAARLASIGLLTAAIARSGRNERRSLTVVSTRGRESHEAQVVDGWHAVPREPDQMVLLAVQSQHTTAALAAMRTADRVLPVVCAQNGVDNERQALRVLPEVLGGMLVCPVTRTSPGIVRSHAIPTYGMLDVGCWPHGDGARGDELAAVLAEDLSTAGFASRAVPDIARWKYAKLLSNVLNAVDALCGWSARQTELADLVVTEAQRCLVVAGIDAPNAVELRERAAGLADYTDVEGIAYTSSSTAQSLERQAGSIEVDYFNGEIARLGRLHGVPTPANELIQRRCWAAAAARQPPASVDPDELLRILRDTARPDA